MTIARVLTGLLTLLLLDGMCVQTFAAVSAPGTPSPTAVLGALGWEGPGADWAWREAVDLKVGQTLTPERVRRCLDDLYQSGRYEFVQVREAATTPAGAALIFSGEPRHILVAWRFIGNATVSDDELSRSMELTWGEHWSLERLALCRQRLIDRYRREGFVNPAVDLTFDVAASGRVQLRVMIDEGAALRVNDVIWRSVGLLQLADDWRDEWELGKGARIKREALGEAVATLEAGLVRRGCFNARVKTHFETPDGRYLGHYQALLDAGLQPYNLVITVDPGMMGKVTVSGDHLLPDAELIESLSVLTRHSVTETEQKISAAALETTYRHQGFPAAQVTPVFERLGQGRFHLDFRVKAGPYRYIEAVVFRGMNGLDENAVQRRIGVEKNWLPFVHTPFSVDDLARRQQQLTEIYRQAGYEHVKVTVATPVVNTQTGGVTIGFAIEEGSRPILRGIRCPGASTEQEAGILQCVSANLGEPYPSAHLQEDLAAVMAFYARIGYPSARVDARLQPDNAGNGATLVFDVNAGLRRKVGRLFIRGLVNTAEPVVRRLSTLKNGDIYNAETLYKLQQKVYETGYFDRVSVRHLRDLVNDDPSRVDILLEVHERETGSFAIGGGLNGGVGQMPNGSNGLQLSAEFAQTNWLGTGRPLRAELAFQPLKTSAIVSWREPSLLDSNALLDLGLAFNRDTRPTGLVTQQFGPTVGLSRQLDSHTLGTVRLGWSRTDYLQASDADRLQAGGVASRVNTTLSAGLNYDSRSDLLNPRWGTRAEWSLDLAPPLLGATQGFIKPKLNWAYYAPFPRKVVLALGAELGAVAPWGSGTGVPPELRFLAGGASSLRGFAVGSVGQATQAGSVTGGTILGVGHLELRAPIWDALGVVTFVDGGHVLSEWSQFLNPTGAGWKLGAGAGIRYFTPIGPLRLDYGYPLLGQTAASGTQWPGEWYVGLGHAF